jgi:hypothetical protein
MSTIHIPQIVRTGGFVPTEAEMGKMNAIVSATPKKSPGPSSARSGTTVLTAINDHLVPMSAAFSDAEREMVATTILWIQHVTTGTLKQMGWSDSKIADPKVRNSQEFWNVVQTVITKYTGWVAISKSYDTTYRDRTYKGSIDIAGVVQTVLKAIASAEAAEQLGQVAANLAVSQDTGVSNVANFFWNHKYHSQSDSQFTISPATKNAAGDPEYTYLFTYESIVQDDWRSLFIQSHYEEFTLSAVGMTLRFYLNIWQQPGIGDAVRQKLSQWLGSDIAHAPVG